MKKLIIFALILTMLLTGCSNNNADTKADDKINIVTTVFPLYDFARAVAGDNAEIKMLIKPGAEVHSFDPSPADIIAIQNADIFLYIGGDGDAWVDTILESMDNSNVKAIKLMDHVELACHEDDHEHSGEHHHEYDEHIWTSFDNACLMLDEICNALTVLDGDNASVYTENAESYKTEINEIKTDISEIVSQSDSKTLIVADRFPFLYFVEEFDLDYISAFDACGSESEASAGVVAALIDEIENMDAPYIYYVELSNHNIADIITEQTGASAIELHSCHNVTKDDFDKGETYVTLWQRNIDALEKGLIY